MKTLIAFFAATMLLCGCDNSHKHSEHCAKDHHEHEEVENKHSEKEHEHTEHKHTEKCDKSIKISAAVQRVMGLKTVKAQKRDIKSTITLPGRFELLPDARESVSTPVAGRLNFAVKPLAMVKKGDILFTITAPELVARQNEIDLIEKRLLVYREIKTKNAALENELAVKKAERAALVANGEEKDGVITLRATNDALVEQFNAKNGDWLDVGESALEMTRPNLLRFKALIAAKDAAQITNSLKAKVGAHEGKVRLGVGDDSGLVPIYIVFDGEINEIAGARKDATIFLSSKESVYTAVPSKCIVDINLQPTVFVKDEHDGEKFIALPVTPLESFNGWTAIEGLAKENSEVVLDGVYELKLALGSDSKKEAGHYHADGTFHADGASH